MHLIWTVKLYTTGGAKKPYRVKVEGNPSRRSDVPWTFAEGKGQTAGDALNEAAESMSQVDQRAFLEFIDGSALKV